MIGMTRIPVNHLYSGYHRHFVHFSINVIKGNYLEDRCQLGRNVWFPSIIGPSLHPDVEGKSKMPSRAKTQGIAIMGIQYLNKDNGKIANLETNPPMLSNLCRRSIS